LGVLVWGESLYRAGRAAGISYGSVREMLLTARPATLGGTAAWVLDSGQPFVMLAGLFRPRLAISRPVIDALGAEELDAAVLHERAHASSYDNLKRLLLLMAPRPFPFHPGFRALERAWTRYAEWAADDRAVSGDPRRSVALAEALVRVARLGTIFKANPLFASLLREGDDLTVRVSRLLEGGPRHEPDSRWLWAAGAISATLCVAASFAGAGMLQTVYRVVEHLIH
jgi:beta-lactamase regulating signal transducer with metallopeptidase domain